MKYISKRFKYPIWIFVAACVLATATAQAQDSTQAKSVLIVKADLFMPTFSIIDSYYRAWAFSIEMPFKTRHSIQVTQLFSTPVKNIESAEYSAIQTIPAYKYYLKAKGSGFFTGAYAKAIFHLPKGPIARQDYEYTFAPALGGLVGYQTFFLKKHLVVDVMIGFGGRKIAWQKDSQGNDVETPYTRRNIQPDAMLGVNIGYNFQKKK